jgi:type IV secretion system protein VirB10
VVYNTGDAQGLLTESLKGTIDIPPTVSKPNGARIQVLVARDLDFRPVYELRARD